MDKFDQIIKKSKPQTKPKADLSDAVMASINRSAISRWIGRLLIGFLFISLAFLILNIFASSEIRSLYGMIINDFDVIAAYPDEFIANLAQSMPWFSLVSTIGIGIIAIWYFRKLKNYAS
ncbi:MAG: hypothetical protein Q8P54_01075 [bacterium]|nr:hypothetical protein [bacterium]